MIFKQIDSSVDKTRKTLALFNKDWNIYKQNWQNANGIFGKIGSIFSSSKGTSSNIISNEQLQILRNWNNAVKHGCTNQETFNRIIANADENTKMYFAGLNKGKGSIDGLKNAQNAAKSSTIGLTIAQTALNTAINMGIGLLVSLVVKGIDKLIHANEEAIEKAEKLREKYEEFKSTNESNVSTLKGLEEEFKDLSKGVSQYGDNVSLTTEQYERYKEIIQQIVGISPSLAEGYSTENGYIADKNSLLERAIELQEQEYRNELRKKTNLDNLKTSMSGYIAEYKKSFDGGLATEDMSAIATKKATEFSNALYKAFNVVDRNDYNSENFARDILKSLGIDDIEKEMQKFFNDNGFYQSDWFFKEYADEIAKNINAITDALSYENVELNEDEFENRILTVKDCAQAYLDMKDSISMANESIQRDLQYIAEYADGYSNLTTEQQKFVNEFLKGFNIDDIVSRDWFGNLTYDEAKMKSVKRQIIDFVEALSQDETTKTALADLYAIPTDEQSIDEYIEQFRNALEVIQAYCKENGIEIPIAISDSEQTINNLEAQYQRAVDFAKNKFDGYDPTEFFKEHSINTQEEIDAWQKIAQGARDAAEAEKEYLSQGRKSDEAAPLSISETIDQLNTQLKPAFDALKSAYQDIFTDDGFTLDNVDISMLSSIKSTIDELNNMEDVDINIDYSSFENLAKVLKDSSSTADDVHEAMNSLATDVVSALNPAISSCSGENYKLVQGLLESVGIMNSEEVMVSSLGYTYEEYIAAKEEAAGAGFDLANATESEIDTFAREALESDNCGEALALLQLKKVLVNNTQINTAADVQQIINLASAAGMGSEVLTKLANAKSILGTVEAGGTVSLSAYEKALSDIESAKQTIFDWKPVEIDFNGAAKSAKKSGKDTADAYLEAFEKELKELEELKAAGFISEKEYLDRLRVLYERYFKDKLGYEKEFAKYQKQYLDGYKSLYESVFSHATKVIDDRIDAINDEKDAAIDSLEAQKKAAEDSYNAQIALLEKKKDALQDEIDKIKEANEDRKEAIDLQKAEYELERMQNQRTILQYSEEKGMHYVTDTSGIRDAKNDLDDKKADAQIRALEKQQDALDKQIESFQDMLDASNEYWDAQIEQVENYYDTMVKGLEEYRKQWEELSDLQEHAEMIALLKELGFTEEDLLNQSSGAFETLRTSYLGILKDLNEGNQGVLDGLSKLANVDMSSIPSFLSETKGYIDSIANMDVTALSDGLSDVSNGFSNIADSASSAASAISGGGGNTASSSGQAASGGETSSSTSGGNSAPLTEAIREVSIDSVEEINKISDAFAGESEEGTSVTGAVQKVMDKIGSSDADKESSDTLMSTLTEQTEAALDEEKGIPAQKTAWEDLNEPLSESVDLVTTLQSTLEDMDGKEFTVILNVEGNGLSNSIVSEFGGGGSNTPSHGGGGHSRADGTANVQGNWGTKKSDIVFNHLQTRELLSKGNYVGRGMALANGTALATGTNEEGWTILSDGRQIKPLQPGDKTYDMLQKFNAYFRSIDNNIERLTPNSMYVQNSQMRDVTNQIPNSNNWVNNRTVQPVVNQEFHITLPNVTNSTSAESLLNDLQSIATKKFQVNW